LVTDHARNEQYKVYVKSLIFTCVEHSSTLVSFISETKCRSRSREAYWIRKWKR